MTKSSLIAVGSRPRPKPDEQLPLQEKMMMLNMEQGHSEGRAGLLLSYVVPAGVVAGVLLVLIAVQSRAE